MADSNRDEHWKDALNIFINKPFWPLGMGDFPAQLNYKDLPNSNTSSMVVNGIEISWHPLPHPQKCLAYKLKMQGHTVVIATDVEYAMDNIDAGFIKFCEGVDYLLFDTHYTPEEYPHFVGWGHSAWDVSAKTANEAGVKHLVLTHYAPEKKDAEIDRIVDETKAIFPNTIAAHENLTLFE